MNILVDFEEEELIVSEEDLALDDGWGEPLSQDKAPEPSHSVVGDGWSRYWTMMMAQCISLRQFDALLGVVFECKRIYQYSENVKWYFRREIFPSIP